MTTTATKVALITGSTSGIGLASARALAKRGVNIIISGFGNDDVISSIVSEITGYGVRADYIPADLSKMADIESLWSSVTSLYSNGIDILVNCAAFWFDGPVESIPDNIWDQQIGVMLTAPFHLIKRCLPAMKAKGSGRIVNLSSDLGLVGMLNCAAYSAAKHGVIGLTKGVALECATHGITCNAVCPGPVQTPLLASSCEQIATSQGTTADVILSNVLQEMPSGKLIQPSQVAELVEFLCLSNASSQMTGAAYVIDGGCIAK